MVGDTRTVRTVPFILRCRGETVKADRPIWNKMKPSLILISIIYLDSITNHSITNHAVLAVCP